MSLDTLGIPTGDLLPLLMGPGLLASAPALYTWKLSSNFVQQISRQFTIPPKQGR